MLTRYWLLLAVQINISYNNLCGAKYGGTYTADGIKAIAESISVSASITSIGEDGLNLEGNNLGNEGWGAIFAAVCGSEVSKITSIDASREIIGSEGAELIAEALRNTVNASVTSVSLSMGEEGKALLRKAVEGRQRFELRIQNLQRIPTLQRQNAICI